jgi:hypothetical protein
MRIALSIVGFLFGPDAPWRVDWTCGCALIIVTVIAHAFALLFIIQKAIAIHDAIATERHGGPRSAIVIGAVTLLATILHGIEAGIWAIAYVFIGALANPTTAMLYSLGALTTYGHQDVYLQYHWQLLGPIEALNGWLLFGLSTAFLFWMILRISPNIRANH